MGKRTYLLLALSVALGAALGAAFWLAAAPRRNPDFFATESLSRAAARPALLNPSLTPRPADASPGSATAPQREPPSLPKTRTTLTPSLENTDNYVLFGIDLRADGKGALLADSIIVLVLDQRSGHVGLVSVPRDAYVDLGDAGFGRINTVLQVARHSGKDPLELGKRVVGDTLALPIRHALALDLGVFERAVDELGGVTVNVPCAIRDRFVDAREPSGYRWLDVDPGQVRMDGAMAALYVRSRHGRSDFSRARRQQAVLLGLRAELESAGGLTRLPALWEQFEKSVQTDLRRYQLLDLGRRILAAGPERLHGLVLNHPHVHPLTTEEGNAVLELDRDAVTQALRSLFWREPPAHPAAKFVRPRTRLWADG